MPDVNATAATLLVAASNGAANRAPLTQGRQYGTVKIAAPA